MKAWGANFKYHGFNVDMNNKTPFECIPNALFKMYGNRDAGRSKFISPVCKGGIEYIKTILNLYHQIDESNLDEGIINNKPIGYMPVDIVSFCNKFKIKCFGNNFKKERFITNKDYDIPFNENLPVFVFILTTNIFI